MKKWKLWVLAVLGVVSVLGNVFLSVQLRNEKRKVEFWKGNTDKMYKECLGQMSTLLLELPADPERRQQKLAVLIEYYHMATQANFYSSYVDNLAANNLTNLYFYLRDLTENDAMWQEALTELGERALSLQGEEQREKPGS